MAFRPSSNPRACARCRCSRLSCNAPFLRRLLRGFLPGEAMLSEHASLELRGFLAQAPRVQRPERRDQALLRLAPGAFAMPLISRLRFAAGGIRRWNQGLRLRGQHTQFSRGSALSDHRSYLRRAPTGTGPARQPSS